MPSTIAKSTIDSGTNSPTITEEFAQHSGLVMPAPLKINEDISPRNGNTVVSRIIKQVSGKKIQISLRQLLELVKPGIQQDIINLIENPDIARK